MSLAAQTREFEGIQPAWATLQPQLATWRTDSSSSASEGSEVAMRPSEEAERRIGDGAGRKCRTVMSSEWVEACVRSGAAGWRGSLWGVSCRGGRW